MQDASVPLHRACGINLMWHGQSMHDPDGYGLIRAFPDMASLQAAQAAFHDSAAWRNGPREAIIACIETATKVIAPMNADVIEGLRKQGCFQSRKDV